MRPPTQPLRLKRSALPGFFYLPLAAAALFGLLASGAPAEADEPVSFASAGQGEPIQGYLSRPKGAGPFPAVVLLHTCLGLPAERASIGARIAAWGYVALFVDDFATRGLKETCAVDFPQALADAEGALAYLASLPYVDRPRIAAVGFSQGGDTRAQDRSRRRGRLQGGCCFLPSMRQPGWRVARHTHAYRRWREGRSDSRGGLRAAREAAGARHGEVRGLSRRGSRL